MIKQPPPTTNPKLKIFNVPPESATPVGKTGVDGDGADESSNIQNQRIPKIDKGQQERRKSSNSINIHKAKHKTKKNNIPDQIVKAEPVKKLKMRWTVKQLYNTELPEQRWAVPGFIPIGLTFLCGLPKAGKSWLALQIASAVGSGGEVFGTKVEKRKVLYLALEDGPHRLQSRIRSQRVPEDTDITFENSWAFLEVGGQEDLELAIQDEKFAFIVIDTLSRACNNDQLKSDEMTKVLSPLQKMALIYNLSVLVIDHVSKGRQGDPVETLYGSIAKSGVADMIYALNRKDNEAKAILKGQGRDIGVIGEENEIYLNWNKDGCVWETSQDPPSNAKPGSFKDKVIKAIIELEYIRKNPTSTAIAEQLGSKTKQPNVAATLTELWNDGYVMKLGKIGREVPYVVIK
jgi:hypothetical protein